MSEITNFLQSPTSDWRFTPWALSLIHCLSRGHAVSAGCRNGFIRSCTAETSHNEGNSGFPELVRVRVPLFAHTLQAAKGPSPPVLPCVGFTVHEAPLGSSPTARSIPGTQGSPTAPACPWPCAPSSKHRWDAHSSPEGTASGLQGPAPAYVKAAASCQHLLIDLSPVSFLAGCFCGENERKMV